MSEDTNTQANTQSATADVTPTVKEPTQAQQVDIKAITEEAVKSANSQAEKILKERLTEAAKALNPELAPDKKDNPVLERFVSRPEEVLIEVINMAKEEAKKEINSEQTVKRKAQEAAAPFFQEYPGIEKHTAYIEANINAVRNANPDISPEEAVKEGCKRTVEALGLKAITQEDRRRQMLNAGMPVSMSGGYGNAEPEYDSNKSSQDYIAALRAKQKSYQKVKASA